MQATRSVALAALLLSGCAATSAEHSCFVGLNLIPPSPIVICGVDLKRESPAETLPLP